MLLGPFKHLRFLRALAQPPLAVGQFQYEILIHIINIYVKSELYCYPKQVVIKEMHVWRKERGLPGGGFPNAAWD